MFFKRSFIVRKDTTYFFNGQNGGTCKNLCLAKYL